MSFDFSTVSKATLLAARNIKCAIFDVDGVLTNGQLHYSENGELVKVFNVLDGHGLKQLKNAGIFVAIISAKSSKALIRRLDDLQIDDQYLGVNDKVKAFSTLLEKHQLQEDQCCYTGDDVIDIPVMQKCGLAFSVPNAHPNTKNAADWVTPIQGGEGAARIISDLILHAKGISLN